MSGYPLVLLLASLPAVGNFAGALLAEVFDVSERALSLALHLAAGIVLGVIGIELMPRALKASLPWVPLVAFVVGGALFLGLERLIGYAKGRLGGDDQTGPLAIFSGVSIDLFSDGVLIGTGSIISPGLGLLLALGQVPADGPEGFAAAATLRRNGAPRRTRLLLAAAIRRARPGRRHPGLVRAARSLRAGHPQRSGLTGGALLTVVVEEMVPEAHGGDTSRWGAIFLSAGFAIFGAVSVYIG